MRPSLTPARIRTTRSAHIRAHTSASTARPGRNGDTRCRKSNSARYTLPTPASTDWSISRAPIGVRLAAIRRNARPPSARRRRGSGAGRARVAGTPGPGGTPAGGPPGAAAQRIGAEAVEDRGHLGPGEHLAGGRAAQVGPHPAAVGTVALPAHPQRTLRRRRDAAAGGERAVQAQVHVDDVGPERAEQV